MSRDEVLQGITWKVKMPDKPHIYLTVNHDNAGKPCEVFIRYDKPEFFEWVTSLTVQITRSLEAGVPYETVVKDLTEIHSPTTRHFIPGGQGECPSFVARIGMALKTHVDFLKANPHYFIAGGRIIPMLSD